MKTILLRIAAVLLGTASLKAAEPLLNKLPDPEGGWITSDLTLNWSTNDVNNKAAISPGFRTASNSTHTYVTGWAGKYVLVWQWHWDSSAGWVWLPGFELRFDGYINKVDPGGAVVWTKYLSDITGDSSGGWGINDIAVEGKEIYVCGTRLGTRAFVAKLTDTDTSLVCNDFTYIEGLTGTGVSNAWATARSIAISTVDGARRIVVGGEIQGKTMQVLEKAKTTSPSPRFTSMVLRCEINGTEKSDGWVMTFDSGLSGTYGTTWGYHQCNDSITAVTADNTGKLYIALKSQDPDANPDGRMHHVDDSRRTVRDTNQTGVLLTGGIYHDYDFWPGSTTLLFKLDPSSDTQPVTHFFYPCKLESDESNSHNHITDIAYLGGKIYVWGDYSAWLRPVSHTVDATHKYLSSGGTSDCFLAQLNADTLIHEKWRLWNSAGEDRATELTVTSSGIYVAGRAGAALSTISGTVSELGGTKTNLPGESTAAHLFWDKISTADLSTSWHIAPLEGNGASIPSTQIASGIGVTGNSVLITGGWHGGGLTMGTPASSKTLPAPANPSGFLGFLAADTGAWKQGVKVEIISAYGNPQPQRGTISLTAGGTISASVEPVIYENASGQIMNSSDQAAISSSAVTRRICTGYQFKNSQVNGTGHAVSFVASTDMELTFNWRTEYAVEVESNLAGSGGLTSPAAGDPEPAVQKHWIKENDQFTAFIDGAAADSGQPGVRWRSTGYLATGCVAAAAGTTSGNTVRWPAYQPRQQTPKITVGGPGRIQWQWEKEYSVRVAVNSSVASSATTLQAPPRFIRADSVTGFPGNWLSIHPPEAANDGGGNKYLNQAKLNTGVIYTYAGGLAANRLRLQIAGDIPDRDPTTFTVEGRSAGGAWVSIAGSTPIPASARLAVLEFPLTNTVSYDEYRITFPTIANTGTDAMQIDEITLGATVRYTGTGEFWAPVGGSMTASAPASVSSGISVLALKGYIGGLGSVSPYDQRGVSTKTFTLHEPSSITWDYARAIYPETVIVGQPVAFSGVTGVDSTGVNRTKAPSGGSVQVAPSGSTFADMFTWDATAQKTLVLRPGKFTVEFENKAAANDPAQNVIVEVNAVWGTPDYTHIMEAPPVDIDPSASDALKFLSLAYSEGGARVSGSNYASPEPGRSVLLYSTRTGGTATGNLSQEQLAVKVVNTLPWAASAQASGRWAVPVDIGQEIVSGDHTTAVGHNGYVLGELAPVNAAAHNRETATGPIFAVNENFPDTGRWSSGNDPAQTRLLAGRIIEFDSADDLLLDPATAKVAVGLNGDFDRTVNGVTFLTDGLNFSGGVVSANGITVTTQSQFTINDWTAPVLTGPSAGELAQIMRDFRYSGAPGTVDVTISGLTPGQVYNIQLLTNESGTADRRFDIAVNGTLAVDNYTSSGHSAGRRWRLDNSYAWSAEYIAPGDGILRVKLGRQLGGNPANGADNNPILNAVVVHQVNSVRAAGSPVIHEPGTMTVAWYQQRDGINWPWQAVRYVPQWPSAPGRIVTASRLGSEGLAGPARFEPGGFPWAVTSAVTAGSPVWQRPSADRTAVTSAPVKYAVVALSCRTNDNSWVKPHGWSPLVFVYANAFNPGKPLENLVSSGAPPEGNWGGNGFLDANRLYYIVISQNNPGDPIGAFDVDPDRECDIYSLQPELTGASFTAPFIYNQPAADAPGYNPNEEHSLIAPSFLDPARPAAFALRSDLNRTVADGDFTSKPYTLVQYTDKTDAANPVVKMAVYAIADEDAATVDPRLPAYNQAYTYRYQGEAGQRLLPPYPLDVVIGPSTWPEETNAENVDGRVAYHEDKKNNAWIVSGDTDTAEDIRAELFYPVRADFWHPTLGIGDSISLGHLPGTSPVRDILYNTVWPADVAVLKAGETLTFSGGEYASDNSSATPRPKGLPGAVAWQCGKQLFDGANPTMAAAQAGTNYMARVFPALSKREVALSFTSVPASLQPASGNVIVEGLIWRFKQLPASLQKRLYYDASSQKLGFRGYLNDQTLGDRDLLVAPGAQTVLQANVITESDATLIGALSTAPAWSSAVSQLVTLSRSPLGATAAASYPIGLEPASGGALPATVFGPGLAVITNPELQSSGTSSSLPDDYITIAENDDESLGDAPVAIHVIKVSRQKYRGSIAVLKPENVFDEKLTLRHTADFGGDVNDLFFEWYYKEEDGRDLNPPGINLPTAGTPTGADWTVFGSGVGLNEIQLSGASPATLTDNVFYVRYRHKDDAGNWSAWGGAANSREPKPASPSAAEDIAYVAQLAPGWIKRVTDGVNLFDARIRDFRNNNAPATYTSMIQQAGQRWEGPVAFNPQKDAIENFGLIELYQTVLDRGMDLSIDLAPGTNGVNTALLNAANRIAGLYTLMGNEAMADAADPTVGFSTVSGQFGRLSPVLHSFRNQTGNLLQEELALLRGRGEVGARPAYNRLLWNFTNGDGEAAYVMNYGITDLNNDGFLNDVDARRLYPQGHGDAWGHYTMAMKGYYDLATLNNFTWVSRSEKYLIDGIVLDVDYLDERAFAKTAAARAQCGAQLVDLVYRQAYTENPNGQWQGYRDTNTDRAWGVLETAQRTGTAALCDWLTANAMLKGEETDPAKTGIRKVDRTTVGELSLIAAQAAAIQSKLDSADRGMNPAGLDPDVVPFDIDPVLTDRTNVNAATHFEQIYGRAVGSNRNALLAFDHASAAGLQLRRTAASTEALRRQAQDQDLAYRNRLIGYFGTPYEGMIGAGKAYPEGYSGPDLYLFLYMDQVSAGGDLLPELDDDIVPTTIVPGLRNLATDTNPFLDGATGVDGLLKDTVSTYFPADVQLPSTAGATVTLNLPRRASGYALTAPSDWGQRRSPGAIQAALQQLVQAEWKLRMAVDAYEGTSDDFKLLLRKFEIKSGIASEKIRLAAYAEDRQDALHIAASTVFSAGAVAEQTRDFLGSIEDTVIEGMPKVVGLASDATAPARAIIKGGASAADVVLRILSTASQIAQYRLELEAEEAMVEMEQALLTEDLRSELVDILAEIQQLANDEGDLRVAVIDALEAMRAASDRVRTVTQEGLAIIDERTVFNQRVASTTTQMRYEDYTFRVTHTEALRKYQSSFDLAARSAYLAGKAYAYELNLPDNHAANATPLLAEMLRTRTLGEWDGTSPVIGQGGIAEQLAMLKTNFDTLKGQLGFNNPATEVNSFSVRAELGRIGLSARVNADWRTKLETWRVPDLWNFQYQNSGVNYGYVFRRYCRPFAPEAAGAQPALVIPFDSSIAAGKNWFGKTLAGGDSSFNASNFSTKIRSAGIRFDGYNNTAMSQTPQVYLVPVGMDRMFLPDSTLLADRSWNVVDQRIPVPLPISPSNLADPDWQPFTGSASGFFEEIRKFSSFRAYHDAGGYSPAEMLSTGRLVGRSVWNTQWVLIIPSATLLNDPANPSAGIDTLIYGAPLPGYTQGTAGTTNRDLIGARDIRILLQTYSISGN